MSEAGPPRHVYTIGIVCALDVEKAAVDAILDEEYGGLERKEGDTNEYTLGRIGVHRVVVACLPAGITGKASAVATAKDMLRSFLIEFGLFVGIAGGVWSEDRDIRLGDVLVSQPDGMHGGIVQWDFGKVESGTGHRRTGSSNRPPVSLLNAMQHLRARHERHGSEISSHLQTMLTRYPRMARNYAHQGHEEDLLFQADYVHIGGPTCSNCDRSKLVLRPERSQTEPLIHYGNIASGDSVIKDAEARDKIAVKEDIIGFEMEAGGLLDWFPCAIVRGVCDYADSHKHKRWQRYAAATAACYVKELLSVTTKAELSHSRVTTIATISPTCALKPFPRSVPATHNYVAREAETERLRDFFDCHSQHENTPFRRKLFVVYGLGGIGKTHLCSDFAQRHASSFSALLWLDGSSRHSIKQSLFEVASKLPACPSQIQHSSGEPTKDIDLSIELLLRWLTRPDNKRWLLIIDNVDRDWIRAINDPEAYDPKDFFPDADHGNILITTRLTFLHTPKAALHLRSVDSSIARQIIEAEADTALLDVDELLTKLGGLPLALVQAGAYIRQTGCSVVAYCRFYDTMWERLMIHQNEFSVSEYEEQSVLTTWKISYDQVRRRSPESAQLLDMCAFLDNGFIWYELLSSSENIQYEGQDAPALPSPGFTDELTFWHCVGILSSYSLILHSPQAGFSIHPVLHRWTRHNVEDAGDHLQMYQLATSLVVASFCSEVPNYEIPNTMRRLIPHARAIADLHELVTDDDPTCRHFHSIASLLQVWADSPSIERLYDRSLQWREKRLGHDHPSTLSTVNNLGNLYTDQGRLDDAERAFMRVLNCHESKLGPDHTSTLNIVNNLGILYLESGQYDEAEKMYVRSLEGRRKALGPQHISTLASISNLGNLRAAQDRPDDAEALYLIALQGRQEVLGSDHVTTLSVVNNLGDLYMKYDSFSDAERMYTVALEGREMALGLEHNSTKQSIASLYELYIRQGRTLEASSLRERLLFDHQKLGLGRIRPMTYHTSSSGHVPRHDVARNQPERPLTKRLIQARYSSFPHATKAKKRE